MDDKETLDADSVQAIPFWTEEKCLEFLGYSHTKQETLSNPGGIKAASIRGLVIDRLSEIIKKKNNAIRIQTELNNSFCCLVDRMVDHVDRHGNFDSTMSRMNLFPICSFTNDREIEIAEWMAKIEHRIKYLEGYRNNYISPEELKEIQKKTTHAKQERETTQLRKTAMQSLRKELGKK